MPLNPRKRSNLAVHVPRVPTPGRSEHDLHPSLRRLTTPDCMSSPVSHLRYLTRDMPDGAKRRRAAQYVRESREQHLQHQRLYLVLDLDETLVHSLRASVRQVGTPAAAVQGEEEEGDGEGEGEDEEDEEDEEGSEDDVDSYYNRTEQRRRPVGMAAAQEMVERVAAAAAAAATATAAVRATVRSGLASRELAASMASDSSPMRSNSRSSSDETGSVSLPTSSLPAIGPLPSDGAVSSTAAAGGAAQPSSPPSVVSDDDVDGREVTLQVQNVEFEMKLRPGVHAFLREMSALFSVHLYTMGSREYVQQALHYLDPQNEIFKPGQARLIAPLALLALLARPVPQRVTFLAHRQADAPCFASPTARCLSHRLPLPPPASPTACLSHRLPLGPLAGRNQILARVAGARSRSS